MPTVNARRLLLALTASQLADPRCCEESVLPYRRGFARNLRWLLDAFSGIDALFFTKPLRTASLLDGPARRVSTASPEIRDGFAQESVCNKTVYVTSSPEIRDGLAEILDGLARNYRLLRPKILNDPYCQAGSRFSSAQDIARQGPLAQARTARQGSHLLQDIARQGFSSTSGHSQAGFLICFRT